MTNTNNTPTDAEVRFSLLEMDDGRPTPAAPAPVAPPPAPVDSSPTCTCRSFLGPSQALPLAVRGVCPRCSRPRARPAAALNATLSRASVPTPADVGSAAAAAELGVQTTVDSGAGRSLVTRTEQQTRARTQQQTVVEVVAPAAEPALRKGDIVAGAAAEGHGVLLGFSGRGSMERSALLATLSVAGMPDDWAPTAKSAHAQAGRILGGLNAAGYVVRADRAKSQTRRSGADVPTWIGRWMVARTGRSAQVGGALGEVVMVATLDADGTLQLQTTDEQLAIGVRTEYEAAIAAELYSASDVSDWLKHTLVVKFRAARLGGTWYVKRRFAADAEKLLTTFSKVWGENFLLPALPVASSEQLRAGIADGFKREVDEQLAEYRARRDECRAETPPRDLSPRSAATMHSKLRALAERCAGFAVLLGDKHVAALRTQLVRASDEIQESMSDIAIRFGLIFDELARDAT